MLRFAIVLGTCALLCGCDSLQVHPRSTLDQQMFGPVSVRIHPSFTRVLDLSGHGKPDGIEATLEIEDQFGEPTRATGRVMFELFDYRKDSPRVRGARFTEPWIFYIDTRAQQQAHWNPALRAYTFRLPYPKIETDRYYVLTVQFDLNSTAALTQPATRPTTRPTTQPTTAPSYPTTAPGGRLFDQLIIEPRQEEKGHEQKYRAPTGAPGH